ncbi:MAG TPA: ferrous iron transport protein A [Pseudomonadales bacterium]|nr:ferrous iron transport protein A [Pseudomonadales bacterium]
MNSPQLAMQYQAAGAADPVWIASQPDRLMLSEVRATEQVTLLQIAGGNQLTLRLLSMGIRPGQQIQVLHNRTGAVVIAAGSGRIAVGKRLAQQITVQRG